MAAKLRDYLNLPGYVYPVSLSRQSSLEPAVDFFFSFSSSLSKKLFYVWKNSSDHSKQGKDPVRKVPNAGMLFI